MIFLLLVLLLPGCSPRDAFARFPTDALVHAKDHGFLWWAYGWRGRSPDNTRVLCIQTSRYGLAFDVDRAGLARLGPISHPLPEQAAVSQSNNVVMDLPHVELLTTVQIGGVAYRAVSAAPDPEQVRIVEHGRFHQRVEVLDLQFRNDRGQAPDAITASYEISAWPDRLAILLHLTGSAAGQLSNPSLALRLPADARVRSTHRDQARLINLGADPAARFAVLRPPHAQWNGDESGQGLQCGVHAPAVGHDGRIRQTLALMLLWPGAQSGSDLEQTVTNELDPRDDLVVSCRGITPYKHGLASSFDRARGMYQVQLGDVAADGWTPVRDPDRLERVAVLLRNPSEAPRRIRLAFSTPGGARLPGIIGMSPMLRDETGYPLGLPVQISKNWHQEHWFNGSTMLELPPHARVPLEFTIGYANWGGVPAVSHAQLCLIGWGGNQLWHEVALGSYGEAICYDPDVNLNRAMIDDVRPLLVRPMGRQNRPAQAPGWTNNVGGGDFLVHIDTQGRRQFLSRMRSAYLRYGPVVSEVIYAGQTPDAGIDARIDVQHYRSDDLTRGVYHVRYDVRRPTRFQRLAFFQLGADQYNDHQFRQIARGDRQGLQEQWPAPEPGHGYARTGIHCSGQTPWFSLHEAVASPRHGGAWANRGMIVRAWRARLGGRDCPEPIAGVYHTNDRVPSVLVELTPPPDLHALQPGDYVEAEIELVVLPMSAEDYLGPNQALRAALTRDANTWRMVLREAAGNRLEVDALGGRIERRYPTRVRCVDADTMEVTITGGVGYLPVTFAGVPDYRAGLEQYISGQWRVVDQSVHGRDFWQTDYDPLLRCWDLSFSLPVDGAGPDSQLRLRLRARTGADSAQN